MVSRLRHTARSIVVAAALGAASVVTPLGASGCFTNQCDGDFQAYPGGALVDGNTWQTTPITGAWLSFPAKRTWHFDTSALGRMPSEVLVWVSTVPNPNEGTSSFAQAAGNLALIHGVTEKELFVTNDSCAEMYLRVVVRATAASTSADAGASANASDAAMSTDGGL
jgi:hypothetical protein